MSDSPEKDKYLSYVLYFMLLRKGSDRFEGLSQVQLESFERSYSESVRAGIRESLAWAVRNPDYDFRTVVQGLTVSNEEIYEYLKRFLASLGPGSNSARAGDAGDERLEARPAEAAIAHATGQVSWVAVAATATGLVLLGGVLAYGLHRLILPLL